MNGTDYVNGTYEKEEKSKKPESATQRFTKRSLG
jgi:hypothetical protein